jgi:hypothetical protein
MKDFRKFTGKGALTAFTYITYYSAARGCLRGRSLLLEMMHPDSINDIYSETFPMIGE